MKIEVRGELAWVTLYENLNSSIEGQTFSAAILTINMFQKSADGWHMILHHGSSVSQPPIRTRVIRFTRVLRQIRLRQLNMKAWVWRTAGILFILALLIVFMFSYPSLYDLLGKVATISLWFVLIFACEMLWNYLIDE